jgi:predicted transcriptional regulator
VKRYHQLGSEVRGPRINKRRQYRNDGRPSTAKWVDHEAGIKTTFQPRKGGKRTRMLATTMYVRAPDMGPDGVECRACGISLSQLGRHITCVHGISCTEYREKYGSDAPLMADYLLKSWIATARQTAKRRHEKNRKRCRLCRKWFQKGKGERHNNAKFCSNDCAFKASSALRSTPEYTEILMKHATLAPKRLKYLDRVTADKRERQTIDCIICGKTFTVRRRLTQGVVGLCSFDCRSEHVRRLRALRPKLPRLSWQQRELLLRLVVERVSTHGNASLGRVMNSLHGLGLVAFEDTTPNRALRKRTPASSHNWCRITETGRALMVELARKRAAVKPKRVVVHADSGVGNPVCGAASKHGWKFGESFNCEKCAQLKAGLRPLGLVKLASV